MAGEYLENQAFNKQMRIEVTEAEKRDKEALSELIGRLIVSPQEGV